MTRIAFPYIGVQAGSASNPAVSARLYRPLASATIFASGGQALKWIVLPDTGADACLFPLYLAAPLGVALSSSPGALTRGVGGRLSTTYFGMIAIDLGRGVSFEAQVGFTNGLEPLGIGLLGQNGFFSRYNVEFRYAAKEFVVEIP